MRNQSPVLFRHFLSEWVVFVVISVFLASLFTYHLYSTHQTTMKQEAEQLVHSASASEFIISKQLESISITLDKVRNVLASNWEKQTKTDKLLNDRLDLLGSAMPSVQAVTLLNKAGIVVASSKPQLIGESFVSRDYFSLVEIAPVEQTLYVSPPFEGVYKDWLIAFSKAILDSDGELAGVIVILLNSQEYKQSLNTLRATVDTRASLAHGDGILFAWEPGDIAFLGQNLARPGSLFSQHLESGRGRSFFADMTLIDNESSLIAIHTINPAKLNMGKPLILGVARNTASLYGKLQKDIFYTATVFIGLNILLGVGLYLSQRTRYKSSLSLAESETKAQKLSQQLTHFFELTPSLMAITDRKGYSQKLNPACERVLGYTLEEVRKKPLSDYIHPDDREKFITTINNVQDKNLHEGLLLRFRSKQGDYRYLDVFLAIQEEIYFLAALDVTHRETEKERLHELAYHDRLTGLPNRALFFDRFQQVIAQSLRNKKKTALLFIDLDGFKQVNDTLGHDAGDSVLKAVANRLTSLVRKSDTVARLGGDEFVILLREVELVQDVLNMAQKIIDTLGEKVQLESGEAPKIGASIGISICPDNGVNLDELLMAADQAMYQSKERGKNTFTLAAVIEK